MPPIPCCAGGGGDGGALFCANNGTAFIPKIRLPARASVVSVLFIAIFLPAATHARFVLRVSGGRARETHFFPAKAHPARHFFCDYFFLFPRNFFFARKSSGGISTGFDLSPQVSRWLIFSPGAGSQAYANTAR